MEQKPVPDCMSCRKKDACERAEAGKFCTEWQSKEPQERHPTPGEKWETGEMPWDM